LRSPYLVFAKRLEPLSDAGRRRKEEIPLVEDNYHKDRIANRRLLASVPWLQFNQLSLMNANEGAFGVNPEYWGSRSPAGRHR
jgi:hypothetical protein